MNVSYPIIWMCALSFSLTFSAISEGQKWNPQLDSDANRNEIPQDLRSAMWSANNGPFNPIAVVESETSNTYYWLSRWSTIGKFDLNRSKNIAGWNLTPTTFPCVELMHCVTSSSNWYTVRWSPHESLERAIVDRYHKSGQSLQPYLDTNEATLGCLGNTPLRRGDVEGDGAEELVLYIGGNWMIFSTTLNKVTFMTMIDVRDWMTEQETLKYFAYYREPENSLLPKEPQYQSSIFPASVGGVYNSTPGYRGYSKLYFGEFDNDSTNAADILVWRKLYQSRLAEDPIKGFKKISDTYAHYSLVNGEYVLQSSDESQIQAWLASNNQTWVTGYPSKSECKGQEGNLIEEMHDPLLNDPDVLPNQASGGD